MRKKKWLPSFYFVRTVKDYIIWVIVWRFGSYVSGPYQEADFNFKRALFGIQERPKRWRKCIVDLEETLEFGLASLYVKKSLSTKGRNMVCKKFFFTFLKVY
jgi:Peptidase family M13.